jgi:hypothetical protein
MIRVLAACTALLAAAALTGCASNKKTAGAHVPPAEVKVYNGTQLAPNQYSVVQRIWIDEWRSSLSYPTFATVDAGLEAMREKASAAGASGLLNVMCMDSTGYKTGRLLCYGDAIKFN